ncbi:MAG: septum formation protein Maf [Dehalococcoidia bacterium]|nr:septum formation protein Maf [Dehalococcoidia bacterium]
MKRLVLASASPRRRDLLALLGLPFEVRIAPGEESKPQSGELAEGSVRRLALEKAQAVANNSGDALVLGADTLVALKGEVLGKPATPAAAISMLQRLRGRRHRVMTGVALVDSLTGSTWVDHRASTVAMRRYTSEEMRRYVASSEPMDKAGAYAVQDPSFAPAERVEGCLLNVVGLPLCLVAFMLRQAGLSPAVKEKEVAARCPDCALVKGG